MVINFQVIEATDSVVGLDSTRFGLEKNSSKNSEKFEYLVENGG